LLLFTQLIRPAFLALTRFKHQHALLVGGVVAVLAGSLSALALAESVEPLAIEPQLEALAEHPMALSRTLILRGPDGLASIFKRAGIVEPLLATQLAQDPLLRQALAARGTRAIDLRSSASGRLLQIRLRQPSSDEATAATHFERIEVRPVDGRWTSSVEVLPLAMSPRFTSGTIRSSLFAATDDVGLPDAVATQMAEIFAADIDFHRELRKGDTFSLVYEALTADGEPVPWAQGSGRVLAAEFRNANRLHQAIWFQSAEDGKGGYYDAQGRSRKRQFLASPMEFSRVTSGFAMRMHPILRQLRAHRGVDYAAPIGTPVRSVGDGVVEFAGVQSGYGKVIEIRHTQERSTLYAHLSRIDVRPGQRIEQGSKIGEVGNTGMSTGPHLHFEFRVAGVHQDPLQIARQADTASLDAAARTQFSTLATAMKLKLELAQATGLEPGRARFE
jgi:murein DD-endopeptidase MepM/ murein hydrolase activator NlpD